MNPQSQESHQTHIRTGKAQRDRDRLVSYLDGCGVEGATRKQIQIALGRDTDKRADDPELGGIVVKGPRCQCPISGRVVRPFVLARYYAPQESPEDLDAEAKQIEAKIKALSVRLAEVRREANRRRVGQGRLW